MARAVDWDTMVKMARRNIQPKYRQLSRMDSNDWLAAFGLERRNVAIDVAQAVGFALIGCAVGVGVGLFLAPKPGAELRRDLNDKVRGTAERLGVVQKERPAYA